MVEKPYNTKLSREEGDAAIFYFNQKKYKTKY